MQIMGVRFNNWNLEESVRYLSEILDQRKRCRIFFVNAHCINVSVRDGAYRDALTAAEIILPDGIGMRIAGRLAGTHVRGNPNGTALFPRLCRLIQKKRRSVYFYGAQPGVAGRLADQVEIDYPGMRVAGTFLGNFTDRGTAYVLRELRGRRPDVLLVAGGVPRQERWIHKHYDSIHVPLVLGVGGLFDFYSGNKRRAPAFVRAMNLEWLHRLLLEPRRLAARYVLGNPVFLMRAIAQALAAGSAQVDES